MTLYRIFTNYFRKEGEKLTIKGPADKSELIKKMDEDLLPNGWEKRESETHVTYTKELSESVSDVFKRYDQDKGKSF